MYFVIFAEIASLRVKSCQEILDLFSLLQYFLVVLFLKFFIRFFLINIAILNINKYIHLYSLLVYKVIFYEKSHLQYK